MRILVSLIAGSALVLPLLAAGAQSQAPPAPTGNVQRGKAAYQTYRCYACHGTSGDTGSPRLVPMTRSQSDFVAFVRKPASAMPAYADVPEQTLVDMYAFIRSLPAAAPPIESIPLLNQVLKSIQ